MKMKSSMLAVLCAGVSVGSLQLATAQYNGGAPGTAPAPAPTGSPGEAPIACEVESRVAALTGTAENPPVNPAGTGAASFGIRSRTEIFFSIAVSGLTSDIVGAHIHIGAPGVNGPIIFPLTPGGFTNSLSGVLRESDFRPAPEQGINTFAEAINAVMNGNTYVNVHTANNPDGEIRGQIVAAQGQ